MVLFLLCVVSCAFVCPVCGWVPVCGAIVSYFLPYLRQSFLTICSPGKVTPKSIQILLSLASTVFRKLKSDKCVCL